MFPGLPRPTISTTCTASRDGRYGYKVRKPTKTTFATIAAIGVMGENVVEQGYVPYILPSNVFTAYGSSTNSLPLYRRLLGADWTDPHDVLIGGAHAPLWWVELEGCPIRKELIGSRSTVLVR